MIPVLVAVGRNIRNAAATRGHRWYIDVRGQFKPGNPGGPGRPRGSLTRVKADLAQLILNGAARAGILKTNSETNLREPTGVDGIDGYLLWAAVHEPKTYLALMARILPYYVSTELPHKGILTREAIDADEDGEGDEEYAGVGLFEE